MNKPLPSPLKSNLAKNSRIEKPEPGHRTTFGALAADSLTLSRCVLAIALVWIGFASDQASLARDAWILVAAWSTDLVDGRVSRMMGKGRQSWLGKNDVYIDMSVSASVLVYLVATNLLPLTIALAYLSIWGILFLRWGIPPVFAQIFQNPIYAYFMVMAVKAAPAILPWLGVWALIAILLFRQRLGELTRNLIQSVQK